MRARWHRAITILAPHAGAAIACTSGCLPDVVAAGRECGSLIQIGSCLPICLHDVEAGDATNARAVGSPIGRAHGATCRSFLSSDKLIGRCYSARRLPSGRPLDPRAQAGSRPACLQWLDLALTPPPPPPSHCAPRRPMLAILPPTRPAFAQKKALPRCTRHQRLRSRLKPCDQSVAEDLGE